MLSKLSRVTLTMHLQPRCKIVEADLEGCQGLCPGPREPAMRSSFAESFSRLAMLACFLMVPRLRRPLS